MRAASKRFLALWEILDATGGKLLSGAPGIEPVGVSTDTRTLLRGQLFVALQGRRYDGHDFVPLALAKGACGVMVGRGKFKAFPQGGSSDAALVEVEDTLFALGEIARAWRERHRAVVVGITGSNGKTTTKEMLASILEPSRSVLRNRGNLNNRIGLPVTLLDLRHHHRAAILEMGMNEPGEIRRLCQIARPEVGLITQVGPAHLEGVGSIEGVAREKGELFSALGPADTAVVNLDDPWVVRLARSCRARKVSYGMAEGAMVRGTQVEPFQPDGARLCLEVAGERLWVRLRGQGAPLVRSALAAAAGAWALGATLGEIQHGLEAFQPAAGRLHVVSLARGGTLIDDTYNANPASMAAALELLCRAGTGRTVAVLGEMRELGLAAPWAHREVGRVAADLGVRVLVAVGTWASQVAEGATEGSGARPVEIHAVESCEEAIGVLRRLLLPGDRILVKGSRGAAMERVVEALLRGQAGVN